MSRPFRRALIDFFFPPKCPFCGEIGKPGSGDAPCHACLAQIRFISSPMCPRCGAAFASPSERDHLCSDCLRAEPLFRKARAACR
ncbi:MAG TPA: double zinc ribbon domain-containing protein, partial [Thermodesulfobacteriota bacterium]|nr:double zinc ribbon domain-containing protein [Thermodesulfobacteriota bacterium]